MSDVSKIDRNFEVKTDLQVDNIKFYSVLQEPFKIYGVFYDDGAFRRLPEKVAKSVSEGVYRLHTHCAGGRVKFVTDSDFVVVKVFLNSAGKMPHFPLTGSVGLDMYVGKKEEYYRSFIPPFDVTDQFESIQHFGSRKRREITINLPLYSGISQLYIGLNEDAVVLKADDYKHKKPIVFYGSSITQGGCASRPGNSYQSIACRELQSDHVNLGFSGNAKAEDEIANYIKNLDMSVFVYDYDHNAPSKEHLSATHQKMFNVIRKANPNLPIVIMSRPKYRPTEEEKARLEIIRKTYNDAISSGDKKVYLIEGKELMKYAKNNGTVDNCHPNDLGFYSMAKVVAKQLKEILK